MSHHRRRIRFSLGSLITFTVVAAVTLGTCRLAYKYDHWLKPSPPGRIIQVGSLRVTGDNSAIVDLDVRGPQELEVWVEVSDRSSSEDRDSKSVWRDRVDHPVGLAQNHRALIRIVFTGEEVFVRDLIANETLFRAPCSRYHVESHHLGSQRFYLGGGVNARSFWCSGIGDGGKEFRLTVEEVMRTKPSVRK